MTDKHNDSRSMHERDGIASSTQSQIDLIREQALQRAAVGMLSEEEDVFVDACRSSYDQASESLPADIQSQLTHRRYQLIDTLVLRDKRRTFLSAYLPVATAVALFLAVTLYTRFEPSISTKFSAEEIQSMAASEDFELYEELEFYQWLHDEDVFS